MICSRAMSLTIRYRMARKAAMRNALRAQMRKHAEKCKYCKTVKR